MVGHYILTKRRLQDNAGRRSRTSVTPSECSARRVYPGTRIAAISGFLILTCAEISITITITASASTYHLLWLERQRTTTKTAQPVISYTLSYTYTLHAMSFCIYIKWLFETKQHSKYLSSNADIANKPIMPICFQLTAIGKQAYTSLTQIAHLLSRRGTYAGDS
jgi:hypothetical protein